MEPSRPASTPSSIPPLLVSIRITPEHGVRTRMPAGSVRWSEVLGDHLHDIRPRVDRVSRAPKTYNVPARGHDDTSWQDTFAVIMTCSERVSHSLPFALALASASALGVNMATTEHKCDYANATK